MALYYTRHDSMTQATATFGAVETDTEGATAGPVPLAPGTSMITSIRASVTINGQWTTDTGFIVILRITGTGATRDGPQDLVLFSGHVNDGAGTLTYTAGKITRPVFIPCRIHVKGGADLSLQASYFAADPGSPQLSVTLEVV